ncbi:MAG: hypothetical protein EOP04_31425 [Proteobacteria bacterium]|nr:MAG: hypothetical protein EOP04_31425 [Pseudomonadota bacterium]
MTETRRINFAEALISGDFLPPNDFVTGLWDGRIAISNLKTAVANIAFDSQGGIPWTLKLNKLSNLMYTGSNDGRIRFWDLKTKSQVGLPLEVSKSAVRASAYDETNHIIYTGDDSGSLKSWKIPLERDPRIIKDRLCDETKTILKTTWFSQKFGFEISDDCD